MTDLAPVSQYRTDLATFLQVLQRDTNITYTHKEGRRFDRVCGANGSTKFFVDRNTHEIFGAKSDFQYNKRRVYGTLSTVTQFTWAFGAACPLPGSEVEAGWLAREAAIVATYKRRGRPRKITATVPTPTQEPVLAEEAA